MTMSMDVVKEWDELFHKNHEDLNNFLYKLIKEYGTFRHDEDKGQDEWILDLLDTRFIYDGTICKVDEYEYIVEELEDDKEEYPTPENPEIIVTKKYKESLEHIKSFIFEDQDLDKKTKLIQKILG